VLKLAALDHPTSNDAVEEIPIADGEFHLGTFLLIPFEPQPVLAQ
jgi:hypothetical protein